MTEPNPQPKPFPSWKTPPYKTTWKPELTPEQKIKYYEDLKNGTVPF